MSEVNPAEKSVGLAKTLGPGSIILLGIGSLLGGGIFTLLGPAAGMAGPALFLAMILGAGVAFLNLQMYLALGTTFPEAGGGYLWVRKGLGNFQGFLAGWLSWFAHAAACGVYALSFGFYAVEFLKIMGAPVPAGSVGLKLIAAAVIIIFGYVNWRGAKTTGSAGNVITLGLLGILALFIGGGLFKMSSAEDPFAHFSPLLPAGIFGIIAAASFFYIAFEGSEIQVQAGEETKNPARDLKIGLIASWAIVSLIYLFVSIVIIGATNAPGAKIWQTLASFGEGAIVRSAQTFMPLGGILMTIGGLLANLAALNATIYSSSHVSFALARDKNLWAALSRIHKKNLTPYAAVAASTILVLIMVAVLPLFDVAAAASLLFVLLFLQLNIAGISIHFKFPDTKWKYKVPFFPAVPIAAIVLYTLLAFAMMRINPIAWMITAIWLLLGLVNYYAYAAAKGREEFQNEIVYEEAVRLGPKRGKRIFLPISPSISTDELRSLTDIALSLAGRFGGEIVAAKIHEVPQTLTLLDGATMSHDRYVLDHVKHRVEEYNRAAPGAERDVSLHNLILVGRDVADVMLDTAKMENCDLLILNWEGYTRTKGAVFGGKIDRVLREAKCDLLVVKNPKPMRSLLLAANPKGKNPHLSLIGEVVGAMRAFYKPKTKLFCVLSAEVPVYFRTDPSQVLKQLGMLENEFDAVRFASARSIVRAVLDEARNAEADLVVVGAARQKPFKDIRFGSIPESLAKHLGCSLFIIKSHRGLKEAFWGKLQSLFSQKTNISPFPGGANLFAPIIRRTKVRPPVLKRIKSALLQ